MTPFQFSHDLGEGDFGPEVKDLQRALMELGHLKGDDNLTGYFGPLTKRAVKDFQAAHGLPPTGYWGELSRNGFSDHVRTLGNPYTEEAAAGAGPVPSERAVTVSPHVAARGHTFLHSAGLIPRLPARAGARVALAAALTLGAVASGAALLQTARRWRRGEEVHVINFKRADSALSAVTPRGKPSWARTRTPVGASVAAAEERAAIGSSPHRTPGSRASQYALQGGGQSNGALQAPASVRNLAWRRQFYTELASGRQRRWLAASPAASLASAAASVPAWAMYLLGLVARFLRALVGRLSGGQGKWQPRLAPGVVGWGSALDQLTSGTGTTREGASSQRGSALAGSVSSQALPLHQQQAGSDGRAARVRVNALKQSARAAEMDSIAAVQALAQERSRIVELEASLVQERRMADKLCQELRVLQQSHGSLIASLKEKYRSSGAARAAAALIFQDLETNYQG